VVAQRHRRHGVGRELARRAVLDALELGLRKLVVEVVAEQEGAVGMFQALGFQAEACCATTSATPRAACTTSCSSPTPCRTSGSR
jgi:ribosomal protein S18 acetylase RimI-like enzyme